MLSGIKTKCLSHWLLPGPSSLEMGQELNLRTSACAQKLGCCLLKDGQFLETSTLI